MNRTVWRATVGDGRDGGLTQSPQSPRRFSEGGKRKGGRWFSAAGRIGVLFTWNLHGVVADGRGRPADDPRRPAFWRGEAKSMKMVENAEMATSHQPQFHEGRIFAGDGIVPGDGNGQRRTTRRKQRDGAGRPAVGPYRRPQTCGIQRSLWRIHVANNGDAPSSDSHVFFDFLQASRIRGMASPSLFFPIHFPSRTSRTLHEMKNASFLRWSGAGGGAIRDGMPEWRNGRRSGLKIRFRKECGFDSRFGHVDGAWNLHGRDGARPSQAFGQVELGGNGLGGPGFVRAEPLDFAGNASGMCRAHVPSSLRRFVVSSATRLARGRDEARPSPAGARLVARTKRRNDETTKGRGGGGRSWIGGRAG